MDNKPNAAPENYDLRLRRHESERLRDSSAGATQKKKMREKRGIVFLGYGVNGFHMSYFVLIFVQFFFSFYRVYVYSFSFSLSATI